MSHGRVTGKSCWEKICERNEKMKNFTYARNCSESFTCIISFSPHNSLIRYYFHFRVVEMKG